MSYELVIRVVYPLKHGKMVLRTDADWDKDVEPSSVYPDQTEFFFHVRTDRPYLYFKPVIVDEGRLFWSQGDNYLATLGATSGRDLYPFFFSPPAGTITDPIPIESELDSSPHRIRIYLPPGYKENTLKRYPTLYMHDGKNLFFPEEAFLGVEWQIDENMDVLDAMNAIDRVLVVGIYANDRRDEYTPPGCQGYGRFVVESLKPWIDEKYRTLTGAENTAVMGSSLGGLVSLYLAWEWPDVFGKVACLSSTFSRNPELMESIAKGPRKKLKFYLDTGWPGDNYEVTRSMRDLLLRKGYRVGEDLLYLAFPHNPHNEQSWATRVHIPFQFFFARVPYFAR